MKNWFSNQRWFAAMVMMFAILFMGISAVSSVKTEETLTPDIVMEWNAAMLDMIKAENISNHFGNRTLAMVHIAMFDSINGIQKKYTQFFVDETQPWLKSPKAAAATAAYTILSRLYPGKQSIFNMLYEEQLSRLTNNPGSERLGVRYGEQVAWAVLEWRQNDGSDQAANVPYPDGTELGQWRRTDEKPPMLPGWGQVTPFAMTSGDQFRLIGAPPMDSYEYARDYNEVKIMGRKNNSPRTIEQTTIARFWPAGIPRMWNLVARNLVEQHQYNLLESARLFALLNVAMADANIAGWDMKYHYGYWRPVTAIQHGDIDGNGSTTGEIGWESLIPSPPFPEYVSGHSISCGAAATILAKLTGTDNFTFTMISEANPSLSPHTFNSFWGAAREAGISRIYGGIHFNFSNVEGLETGRSLGRYVFENFMTPLP